MSRRFFSAWSCCLALSVGLSGCGSKNDPAPEAASNAKESSVAANPKADALVKESVDLIQKRQFNEAITKLSEAIKIDPKCSEAYFQRAGILADAGKDRFALTDYTKAIEINGKDVRFFNMRGLFLLTRRQYENAVQDFTTAVQIDPKYVQAYNNRGLVHLAQSNYSDAIADFNRSVEIDATYIDGFNNRGFAYYQAGNDGKALLDFNKTIELNPKYVNAYNNRAMLYVRNKKYRQAAVDFTSAIEFDPNNIKHYQNRAAAYLELGQKEQAQADLAQVKWLAKLDDLNAAVSRKPNEPKSYIQRANHLAQGGREEIALANFEQAINVAPTSVEGLNGRAQFWFEQGQFAKAISDCNQAIDVLKRSNEWNRRTFSIRGESYLKLGKYDEALADFQATERLDESVALAYYGRAQQRHKRGDTAGSQADLELARQIDPSVGQ